MKRIVWTDPAKANVRRIDRDTAMRILTALDRFVRTGEGDVKALHGETNYGSAPATIGSSSSTSPTSSKSAASSIAAKPTANLEHSPDSSPPMPPDGSRSRTPVLFENGGADMLLMTSNTRSGGVGHLRAPFSAPRQLWERSAEP